MEGRVPPPAGDGDGDDVPPPPPSSSPMPSMVPLTLPFPPGKNPNAETYVIHFPRDQVYRVPPPENAKIVESYQGIQSGNKNRRLRKCLFWYVAPLLVLGIAIAVIVSTVNALHIPKSPEFSVATVRFKNSSLPAQHRKDRRNPVKTHPAFEISLHVENINERMKVSFSDEGKSSLIFKNHVFAKGKFPSVLVEPRGEKDVDLNLDAAKLSGELNNRKTKSMTLKVSVPMKISSWAKNEKKDITVTCVFKVNSLTTTSTKVLSNKCRTNF